MKLTPTIIEEVVCRHFTIKPACLHLEKSRGNETRAISDPTRACILLFTEMIAEMIKPKPIAQWFGYDSKRSDSTIYTSIICAKRFEMHDKVFSRKIKAAREELLLLEAKKEPAPKVVNQKKTAEKKPAAKIDVTKAAIKQLKKANIYPISKSKTNLKKQS